MRELRPKNKTPMAATIGASNQVNLTTGNNSMSNLAVTNQNVTMSSIDFLNEIINPARKDAGEKPVRPSDFHSRVNDEIDEKLNYENFVVGKTGHKTHYTMLTMEQMTLVGMRESKAVRRAVLEKLKELQKPSIDPMAALNDPSFLRSTLLTYTEKVIELESQVEEMKPDVEALTRIAKSQGSMCVTDAAKQLQVKPKSLFDTMSQLKWIYRRLGTPWIGYQDKIQQGLIEHKVTVITKPDGEDKSIPQVRVTPKGLSKLAKLLTQGAAA